MPPQDTDTEIPASGTMGIGSPIIRTIANTSAIVLIGALFTWQMREGMNQAREDRGMFREELRALRQSQEDRWQKTDATHSRQMEKMGSTIERAITSMEAATRTLEKATEKTATDPTNP